MKDAAKRLEPVRLVIWDLDETFWKGTLSEGGITEYLLRNHEIVIELARRGIMSSICSKNDFEVVRDILEKKSLWEYFIFPSITWDPKPERVAHIVDTVQLRGPTVMFIDDNANNRAGVRSAVPGIQVESELFIPRMLDDERFIGKDDSNLSRLNQYKLLQSRQVEQSKSSSNEQFLRQSGIELEIEVDLEPHYSRIVELINRTNQLNFTKKRLSDDEATAIAQLKEQLRSPEVHAGIVRVRDRYGDYGYCGFFLERWGQLEHFCFSCRILGFGVEIWLYQRLYRPKLEVKGEVLVDVQSGTSVDWINVSGLGDTKSQSSELQELKSAVRSVALRAHCESYVLLHYFQFIADEIRAEGPIVASHFCTAGDSLANIYYTLGARTAASKIEFEKLGFYQDLTCKLFSTSSPAAILLISCRDFRTPLYKHRRNDFAVNVFLDGFGADICEMEIKYLREHVRKKCPDDTEYERVMERIERFSLDFSNAASFGRVAAVLNG